MNPMHSLAPAIFTGDFINASLLIAAELNGTENIRWPKNKYINIKFK